MRSVLLAVLPLCILPTITFSQTEIQLPYAPFANDNFGFSVAVDGASAAVGILQADPGVTNGGGVALFTWSGTDWAYEGSFTHSDLSPQDAFGYAVDMAGGFIAASSIYEDTIAHDAGAVYIFEGYQNPVQISRLIDTTGSDEDWFGNDVAISLDALGNPVVVVGAFSKGTRGSVFLFRWDGLGFVQEEIPEPDLGAANFGYSVDIDGDRIAVGAPAADSAFVFFFDGSGWILEAELAGASGSSFGTAVSLSADLLAVGAPLDNDAASSAGAVHLYRRQADNSWPEEEKLTADDAAAGDRFGTTVTAWTGPGKDLLCASSPRGGDDIAFDAGAVYKFILETGTWQQASEMNPSSGGPFDRMGVSMAATVIPEFNDIMVLAGSPSHDEGGFADAGAVYSYIRPAVTCNDIARIKGRCKPNGKAFGAALLSSTEFEGFTLLFSVDNTNIPATVMANRVAAFVASPFNPACTLGLVDPPGCLPPAEADLESGDEDGETGSPLSSQPVVFPNPFNPTTSITFVLSGPEDVTITIHDILGRTVAELVRETRPEGTHRVEWDASAYSSGMYFIVFRAGNQTFSRKVMLLK